MTNEDPAPRPRADPAAVSSRFRVMALAFGVGSLLLGIKFGAYFLTGSAGVLSDALESVINVVASGFALYSVHLSALPADSNHPYGHGKIEYFSAGFEGGLIVLAAAAILWQAIPRFTAPEPLSELGWGALLIAAAAAVNGVLGLLLVRTGRATRSLALEADGRHLFTDVITSLGVVAGLLLVLGTGSPWWDPLVACLVALNILVTGYRLVRKSLGGLLDEADPALLGQIRAVLDDQRSPDWIDVHRLRARRYGHEVTVDLHLVLPRDSALSEAHAQALRAEEALLALPLGVVETIVHTDPCEDSRCPACGREPCSLRIADQQEP